jgi:hypothetical protein
MIRLAPATFALTLLALVSHAIAAGSEDVRVTIETTSAGSVGPCQAEVSRSLQLCDARGQCRRATLGAELDFDLPTGGSFLVIASVSYERDGVIHGDAASDRFARVDDGERLVQTVTTGEHCSKAWSYEFRLR